MNRLSVRTWAALALVLFTATTVRSADAQKIGIMAGANFETLADLNAGGLGASFAASTGYHFGVFAGIGAGPLALRPALLYLNSGDIFSGSVGGGFLGLASFNVSYLALPVDIKISPIPIMYLIGGPEFQLRISSDDAGFSDNMKSLVARGGVGLGLQISRVFLEGRYICGLSSLKQDTYTFGGFSVTGGKQMSNAVRASIGVSF